MKKKIIELLATKFEGVSENILSRIADKLSKTITSEDDLEDAVNKVTFQTVIESYADSRVTEAQKTAVENYKKKHNINDDATPAQQQQERSQEPVQSKSGNDMPEWARALVESNKALSEKIAAMESEKVGNSRKAKLQDAVKGLPEAIANRYTKDFERLQFKDDADFDGWLNEVAPEMAAVAKDFAKPRFNAPKSGGAAMAEDINPMLKARIDERAKAEPASPAIQGLPK